MYSVAQPLYYVLYYFTFHKLSIRMICQSRVEDKHRFVGCNRLGVQGFCFYEGGKILIFLHWSLFMQVE